MKAVTNAGPLIALGKLGLVQLLSQLYDPIFQAILDRDDIWISDALVRRVWDAWRQETASR